MNEILNEKYEVRYKEGEGHGITKKYQERNVMRDTKNGRERY